MLKQTWELNTSSGSLDPVVPSNSHQHGRQILHDKILLQDSKIHFLNKRTETN